MPSRPETATPSATRRSGRCLRAARDAASASERSESRTAPLVLPGAMHRSGGLASPRQGKGMTPIDSRVPLRLAPDLVLRIESDDDVTLTLGDRIGRFPRRALAALAAVAQTPRPFGEIVAQLTAATAKRQVAPAAAQSWRDAYGFDFTEFRHAAEGAVRPFYCLDREMEGWRWIGAPVPLFESSLGAVVHGEPSCRAVLEVTEPATNLGVVLYSALDFGSGWVHEAHPGRTRNGNWRVAVRLAPADAGRNVGTRIEVTANWSSLQYRVGVELRVLR